MSNDLELSPGMTLIPGVWGNSYQEMILRQAIDTHFAKEEALFHRHGNAPRVRVLSLYFIDSISSYRDNDGWLKKTFEKLLHEKIESLIKTVNGDYLDYLLATLASLKSESQKVHGGYFAEDSDKKGDEAIQSEVDDILRNKEKMLQFRDDKGNWNVRRFLFSKWTLREGWDNPNVFVLTKLRTSGSEISKIQEVGRGLRLPVDELGNRLSEEEFRLDFIIDYSEKDFAGKLLGEINADGGKLESGKITDSILDDLVVSGYSTDRNTAFFKLGSQGIVDHERNVLKVDELDRLTPLGVRRGKIRVNTENVAVVHPRKKNWAIIGDMWKEVSKRFMLKYDRISKEELSRLIYEVISTNDVFAGMSGSVTKLSMRIDEESQKLKLFEERIVLSQSYGAMKYGEFLQAVCRRTNMPIDLLHSGLIEVSKGDTSLPEKFNDLSVENFVQTYYVKFFDTYGEKFEYDPLDFVANISIFENGGGVKNEISQGLVGTEIAGDVTVPDNYLYDEPVFDSEIEHEILKLQPHGEVLVFGKIPRRSIRIPVFTGGTTSPDFVYAIRGLNDGEVKIHALIEAKGKNRQSLTGEENMALIAQGKISEKLKDVEIKTVFSAEEVSGIIQEMVNIT